MSASAAIEVVDLTKRYDGFTAVRGATFSVETGELFGFLGPNGAGKTTTLHILCTLLDPTSGSARVAGADTVREATRVREGIGIVFQEPSLDDRLTARENLEFHGMIYHMPKVRRRRRLEEVLKLVSLWDWRDAIVRTFSGGMKRRLEIARGLMHEPDVLFLDEPTIGLDPQTRRRIWETLRHLRTDRRTTLFLTTHSMEEAQACDRVAVMDHGRLLALGPPMDLIAQHRVANLEEVFLNLTGHDLRDGSLSEEQMARSRIRKMRRWA